MDASIEAEINRYRRTTNGHTTTAVAAEPAILAPAEPSTGKARYCTNCGEKLSSTHKFCATCGTPVTPVAVSQN
ncbi:MAG: zinc-ribbon domain-containing protein [Caldilineaceae bacterium]